MVAELHHPPVLLARNRVSILEFIEMLTDGDTVAWIILGALAACIAFFILYEKMTGRPFVKSKKERREARHRRKHVLWEYKRGD